MLFNSYIFLFAFLPIVWFVARWLAANSWRSGVLWWLAAASVVFYTWQSLSFGALFVGSILANYVLAQRLFIATPPYRKLWLTIGVTVNLLFLGYFKYAGFAASIVNGALGTAWPTAACLLPLGISFYTFQQIGYLVDLYRGEIREHRFQDYVLFVTFFPQLVAGPIVSHREIVPQFQRGRMLRFHELDFSLGLTLLAGGLFKKVVLADQFALFANPVFAVSEAGGALPPLAAWIGLLAYTLQLYFDFSGYSDMAIGLGRMFGIRLPLNFNSPYKAVDVVDFWRRWHLTLSGFLRDYLYIPLGGSRGGWLFQTRNLLLTMLLGGLWHGAGWTFVAWGGAHGGLLAVNHLWNRWQKDQEIAAWRFFAGRVATFLVIALTWVLFRSESFGGAVQFYQSLFGLTNAAFDESLWRQVRDAGWWVPAGLLIVWCLPNTQEFMGRCGPALRYRYRPASAGWWQWSPTPWHALLTAGTFVVALSLFSRVSSFIYFNF